MPHLIYLEPFDTASRYPEADPLHGVRLPDSPAVRAEVAAMLRDASRPAPPRPRPVRRLWDWFPRWLGWLRAMPLP